MTPQLASAQPIRSFVRHPTDLPIRIHEDAPGQSRLHNLANVSRGGLACRSDEAMPSGAEVTVEIPVGGKPFRARGLVRWCRQDEDGWEIGIQFVTQEDAYAARMVEQICHIEHYRREVCRHEGRDIDSADAANEWIRLYAARFPDFG